MFSRGLFALIFGEFGAFSEFEEICSSHSCFLWTVETLAKARTSGSASCSDRSTYWRASITCALDAIRPYVETNTTLATNMRLSHFTPLPPTRNGIADYASRVLEALSNDYESQVFCADPFAEAPNGIPVLDPAQAFRWIDSDTCCVYQIGNNFDHTFALRAAIEFPGIVVLHDLRLLYLYEGMNLPAEQMFALAVRSNPILAGVRAAPFVFERQRSRSDYLLFDMLPEIVERSKAVIVHSQYAKAVIRRQFGDEVARKVHVIPHFALEPKREPREAARTRLSLDPNWFVIVTCGFAVRSKRYDWLLEALEHVVSSRRRVIWVQAGSIRPEEYDLEAELQARSAVRPFARLTGYLSEQDLDAYIAAADVVVNLRFPSVGEGSGSLARALAAGVCCIVSDTAAYREYPDNVVVKIPPFDCARRLSRVLLTLMESPAICAAFSKNARSYADDVLSMRNYVRDFKKVIDIARSEGGSQHERLGSGPSRGPTTFVERLDLESDAFGQAQSEALKQGMYLAEAEIVADDASGLPQLRLTGHIPA
jgi:glycosyltransferase involved in cell wall biosynthesis